MFQSAGLFKDVSCPYFLYGLCERPHCHFKHSRKEESLARIEAEASKKETETDESYTAPTSSLQKTLQAIEENIQSEKKKLLVKDNGPEEQIQVKKQAKKPPVKNKPTGTPEYNPTPLQELKKEKTERKHGRSKYDLALLHKPKTDSEYDPMCNYSTNTGSSNNNEDSVPDYAKTLQSNGGVKRTADLEDEEEESPLAKIPKFVSVDYTPTGIEADGSDEEPVGEKEDWFSENESEKSNDSGNAVGVEHSEKEVKAEQSIETSVERKSLPIEFTSDGFVKYTPTKNESKKRTSEQNDKSTTFNTSTKTKTKEKTEDNATRKTDKGADHHVKTREKSNDNIFNLFKDEFDKVFEESKSSREKDGSHSKSKFNSNSDKPRRTSSESDSKSKSAERKSQDSKSDKHTHNNHKHHSDRKSPQSSSSSRHRNGSGHKSSSHEKHSSSSSKQSSSSSKHSASSKDVKTSSSSYKDDKHNSNHDKHNSTHDNHNKHDKHNSKHDKHDKHNSKHDKHDSKYSSSKQHGDSDSKKSHKKLSQHDKVNSGHSTKKKSIVNLDVDLFGEDVLNVSNSRHDEDDFSDLEKYFEDEDPFDECLRIFNEDKGKTEAGKAVEKKKSKKSSTSDNSKPLVASKKRVALKENEEKVKRQKVDDRPKPKPSPAQVMMNRYKMMQERALQEEQDRKAKIKAKVREMQVDKKANQPPPVASSSIPGSAATFTTYMKNKKTSAITVAKGAQRKAHTTTVAIEKLKRPVVEVSSSSKVPANCRQRYLNIFIDECLKLCSSEKEAYDKGKEEEQAVFTRCSNKQIYLNIAVNTVKRIRKEVEEKKTKPSKNGSKTKTKVTHAVMLGGAHAAKTTFTLNRSGGAVKLREEDFLGTELYKRLQPYILPEEQLNINNYPRQDPTKGGCAMFMVEEDTKLKGSVKGYEKICRRCGKRFEVYPNGKYPKKEECIYHWGKAWKKRVTGTIDTRFTCCSGEMSAAGCQVAIAHVHETNKKENLSGYMKTIPCSPPIDGDYGVYAMDCEMVYTTMGMELARVTVVGGDCEVAYESLVQPDNRVVDCNTRFSGILDEDLEDVQTSLRDVQAVLLSLFTDKTILIGHSLESDLTALKLIHSTVVDTAIVFPHRMGLPYKRALKTLMIEYMKKIIQDDVAGHDSQEDAISCIQLMQYKLKEDARKEARRLSN